MITDSLKLNMIVQQDKLLEMSNEIAKARDKIGLLEALRNQFSQLMHFTHLTCTIADHIRGTYRMYIFDSHNPGKNHAFYNRSNHATYSLNDGVMSLISEAPVAERIELSGVINGVDIPEWVTMNYDCGAKWMVALNLKDRFRHIGSFIIFSDAPQQPANEELAILTTLMPSVSTAFINILMNEEREEREYEQTILLSLSSSIAKVRSKGQLARIINENLKKLVPADEFMICLISEDKYWYSPYIFDPDAELSDYAAMTERHRTDTGLASLTAAAGQPLVFDLDELIKREDVPQFLRLKYKAGILEIVYAITPDENGPGAVVIVCMKRKHMISQHNLKLIKGISGLLSSAIANVAANDEIMLRENEKSVLLAFSNDIASIRDENGLTDVIRLGLNKLFGISLYLISLKSEDCLTHSYHLIDMSSAYGNQPGFNKIRDVKFPIKGGMAEVVFDSRGPVLFDVDKVLREGRIAFPSADFWRSIGVDNILGVPLRVGNNAIGILWAHAKEVNNRLMEGVSSQIAVAVAHHIAAKKVDQQLQEISSYKHQLEIENKYLQEEIQTTHNYNEIVGNSEAMDNVFELVSQVANTDSSVLLLGETGTGKELIARAVHNNSSRRNKLMIKVNCAALPANLIESELFGHERGSFTGAIERKIGKFELANNSTLFLDEIGDLPLELQVKLLRAIQEKEIERIGGRAVIKTNVRIIAATNRNLLKDVNEGIFRSDLYFRLNVFPIKLPPLRERREDIPILATFFLQKFAAKSLKGKLSFSAKAIKQMESYTWPGNVRELEHLVERSVLITKGNTIAEVHLSDNNFGDKNPALTSTQIKTIAEVEREHIISVLKKCNGKVSGIGGAAELLRIPSTTLYSKIGKLKIRKGIS